MRHLLRAAALATTIVTMGACGGASSARGGDTAGSMPGHVHHAPESTAAIAETAGAAADLSALSLHDIRTSWRDQTGAERRFADGAGEVRVVAMLYTSCTTACPLILAELERIAAALPARTAHPVRFVLVSLDPARDTPERLASFAREARLDPARWTLLTGEADAVRELAAALGVRYRDLPGGELAHTNAITVVAPDGAVARQQVGLGAGREETIATVRRLAE
jgi:protein SCO1/2